MHVYFDKPPAKESTQCNGGAAVFFAEVVGGGKIVTVWLLSNVERAVGYVFDL